MKVLFLIFSLAVGITAPGCGTSHRAKTPAISPVPLKKSTEIRESKSDPALDNRSEALARFATGISYELNDKSDLALEEFHRASMADPANEGLALDLSRRYLQRRQSDKAVAVLTNSAAQPRASGNLFSWLARAYVTEGKTNLAITAAQTAIKKSPQLISGYQTLSEIFLQTEQFDEVAKILDRASRRTNSDALFLVKLGELYGKAAAADLKKAALHKKRGLDSLNRAAGLKPDNANLQQKLADNFAELGDAKNAAEIYLQLLSEFSDVPLMRDTLRKKLTNLYLRSNDKSKAIEQLEAVVRDNPTRYPEAWYFLGTLANDATNYSKAAEYFGRAIVVAPEMQPAYYDLAGMQINLNQGAEALTTLEKARAKFPNTFTGEFFTGLAFSRMKDYSTAVKHFTAAEIIGKAAETNRVNHLFYFQVGATYERKGDYAQAAEYFQKSLALEPDFADALNYLGFMWADRGENLEKAHQMIQRAVELEPDNAAYLDSLGWALFKLNQNRRALDYLLKAAALSEEPDAAIYDHIGDVYAALKETGKAREAWQKSLAIEPSESIQKKLNKGSPL